MRERDRVRKLRAKEVRAMVGTANGGGDTWRMEDEAKAERRWARRRGREEDGWEGDGGQGGNR